MEVLESQLRSFIANNFFIEPGELEGDTSLIGSGTVDSTGVLEIILHLEETYGITVADSEALPKNLDTINNLVSYVTFKQAAAIA